MSGSRLSLHFISLIGSLASPMAHCKYMDSASGFPGVRLWACEELEIGNSGLDAEDFQDLQTAEIAFGPL